ncbi:DUF2854 domain-containing protein [Oscillatoria sp. FACHB-1406]|uniref:DUF2854 domain-containing protein n=1 Tax=Oscillatoria sp. FACHB-1406 TaxID=2692846 RepID=UPI0016881A7F|nr:DUF2854 domain-containing protein [Oscillatoria sp. FACHB-1406]MBD2578599.1 DUF2854 domain-containing protein [Oscillatoria sp. FACHB-1406]
MLRKISLGNLGLVVGGAMTLIGITSYFLNLNPTLDLIGIFYGGPILLGGFALKAAELKPATYSQETPPEVVALREQQATKIQNQIRSDVTRFRYGQEVHLDDSLQRLGLSPTDEERPILRSVREENRDGSYTLVLEFESPFMTLETWQQRREKIEKFFGPGIRVELNQPKQDWVEAALISTGNE